MTSGLYVIRDNVAKAIGQIMVHHHEAAAIRVFKDVAKDKEGMIGAHPQDFDLVNIGLIDTDTGAIITDFDKDGKPITDSRNYRMVLEGKTLAPTQELKAVK